MHIKRPSLTRAILKDVQRHGTVYLHAPRGGGKSDFLLHDLHATCVQKGKPVLLMNSLSLTKLKEAIYALKPEVAESKKSWKVALADAGLKNLLVLFDIEDPAKLDDEGLDLFLNLRYLGIQAIFAMDSGTPLNDLISLTYGAVNPVYDIKLDARFARKAFACVTANQVVAEQALMEKLVVSLFVYGKQAGNARVLISALGIYLNPMASLRDSTDDEVSASKPANLRRLALAAEQAWRSDMRYFEGSCHVFSMAAVTLLAFIAMNPGFLAADKLPDYVEDELAVAAEEESLSESEVLAFSLLDLKLSGLLYQGPSGAYYASSAAQLELGRPMPYTPISNATRTLVRPYAK